MSTIHDFIGANPVYQIDTDYAIAYLQKKVELMERLIMAVPELKREYEKLMMVDTLMGDEK